MNEKKSFYVIGMSCAGCAANIQQALSERKGVIEARVNFAASDVIVEYNPTLVSDKDLQKTYRKQATICCWKMRQSLNRPKFYNEKPMINYTGKR